MKNLVDLDMNGLLVLSVLQQATNKKPAMSRQELCDKVDLLTGRKCHRLGMGTKLKSLIGKGFVSIRIIKAGKGMYKITKKGKEQVRITLESIDSWNECTGSRRSEEGEGNYPTGNLLTDSYRVCETPL